VTPDTEARPNEPRTEREYLGTQRHANDPETQNRRVMVCVKCGDRHTVDVAPLKSEVQDELRERAAGLASQGHEHGGGTCGWDDAFRAVLALDYGDKDMLANVWAVARRRAEQLHDRLTAASAPESRSVQRRKNVMAGRDVNEGIDTETRLLREQEARKIRQQDHENREGTW
jgi:hypothetical protein